MIGVAPQTEAAAYSDAFRRVRQSVKSPDSPVIDTPAPFRLSFQRCHPGRSDRTSLHNRLAGHMAAEPLLSSTLRRAASMRQYMSAARRRTMSPAAAAGPRPSPWPSTAAAPASITVTGTLAAEDQVVLGFKVAGRVDDVRVDLGSRVTQGQIVATLVATDFELRVRQAEAALVRRACVWASRRTATRARSMPRTPRSFGSVARPSHGCASEPRSHEDVPRTRTDIAARTLESAEAALEVAEGQYQDALEEIRNREGMLAQRRSELEIARQQLQDTVLRAPLDGAVRERQVAVGEYRAPGHASLTVVRTHPLRLKLAVPERETAGAADRSAGPRQRRRRHPRARRRLERIGAAVDEANRTLPVEAVVPNPNDRASSRDSSRRPRSSSVSASPRWWYRATPS